MILHIAKLIFFFVFDKSAFELWAVAFSTCGHLFELCDFFTFWAKPYYQKLCIDPGIILGFWQQSEVDM